MHVHICIYYINTSEIPGELSHVNMISSRWNGVNADDSQIYFSFDSSCCLSAVVSRSQAC